MSKELISQDWFQSLIDDCSSLITESEFNARWDLIRAYHKLGGLILQAKSNFEANGIRDKEIVQHVANAMKKSSRTIYYAIQFAETYPDINQLPGGKDVSWRKVCTNLLPTRTKDACKHAEYEEIVIRKCKQCHKKL